MSNSFGSNELTDNPENKLDKTIDESAISSSYHTIYNQTGLPSGEEPIRLGSGTIAGVLGTGGMAKVYKIWNEKLEIYRAVKIILPSRHCELSKRFETEAKITAKLHHPNIVEIYNVGEWNELPFIEMELVEGETLDTIIAKNGRLPDVVCSAIGIQITDALSYAHSREILIYGKTYNGIIHRDLKPANIMVSGTGEMKLMDFGIARPTETGLHTTDGHIVGTLQYLSPEQLDGIEIDKRSDIYSLGTILYEMLTGTKTFPQQTITNLMKMKSTNAYRRFKEFNFSTKASLSKLVEKCLKFNRIDRYENTNVLLNDLKKIHSNSTSDSPKDVLQKYIRDPGRYTPDPSLKRTVHAGFLIGAGLITVLSITAVVVFSLNSGILFKETAKKGKTVSGTKPEVNLAVQKKLRGKPSATVSMKDKPTKPSSVLSTVKKEARIPVVEANKAKATLPIKKSIQKHTELSPITGLQKKYDSRDLIDIGEKACRKGEYKEAITALKAVPDNHPDNLRKELYLLLSYMETKQLANARELTSSIKTNDAFFELLYGRLEAQTGNDKKALECYQSALTKPSRIKSRETIRNDALYYTALIYDKHYIRSSSEENRFHALNAWNNLKRVYSATPDHPRFKIANRKLADIH